MTSDGRKGLLISYNILNLQEKLKEGETVVAEYSYLSDGTKCSVASGGSGYHYLGSFIYQQSGVTTSFESANFGGGRVVYSNGSYSPYYYTADQLGSIRVITDGNGAIVERSDYYPFGEQHANSNYPQLSSNRWKFNGKELQTSGNTAFLDYGARMYDPIGRFHTIDPKAEQYPWQSPYCYAANNPIILIDENGENPAVPIALGVVALDVLLITTGIVTTGIILHKVADGSLAINNNVSNFFYKDNPGYREQQKRERASQRETYQIKLNHAKSVANNIGKPSPDGGNTPKGGGSTKDKIVAGMGFLAELTKIFNEVTGRHYLNRSREDVFENQIDREMEVTIDQGITATNNTKRVENNPNPLTTTYRVPMNNTRINIPIIKTIQIDEKN